MTYEESRDWVLAKINQLGYAYDMSLPQSFVDGLREGVQTPDLRFVWVYPAGSVFGLPAPLTLEARRCCEDHNWSYWDGLSSEEQLRIREAD